MFKLYKEWYKNYFTALAPKLEVVGCFTTHNARSTWMKGIKEFMDYVRCILDNETIDIG